MIMDSVSATPSAVPDGTVIPSREGYDPEARMKELESRAEIAEWDLAYTKVFGALTSRARTMGMIPGFENDVWALAGVDPTEFENVELDETTNKLGDKVAKVRERHPAMFDPALARTDAHGQHLDAPDDEIPDDDPRMRDSAWQFNNQDKLIASSKARLRKMGYSS
jgi:hypothetical protein